MTDRQQKFCIEYVRSGNAASAYKAAYAVTNGNTAKTNGSKLLRDPAVQSCIAELQGEIANEKICDAREVQERLSSIARRECTETVYLPNGEQVQRQASIRDSVRALEMLCKIYNLFIQRQEIDVNASLPVFIHDDI